MNKEMILKDSSNYCRKSIVALLVFIFAAVLFMLSESTYAANNLTINSPADNVSVEVNKELTIKAKGMVEGNYGKNNYMWLRITKAGETKIYTSSEFKPTTVIMIPSIPEQSFSFTPEDSGEYKIEVQVSMSKELAESDFVPEASRTFFAYKDISKAEVQGVENKIYTGDAITQSIVVTLDGKTLAEGTDYDLEYSNNTTAGNNAKVKIIGKGDYFKSIEKSFTISKAKISDTNITGIIDKEYTGSEITQTPVVKLGKKDLADGSDYSISYSNNINIGDKTAIVKITGKGSCEGTVEVPFSILPIDISNGTVTGIEDKEYTMWPVSQNQKLTVNGKELKYNEDYTIETGDNTNVGTVRVVFTGKGIYGGTKTVSFKITPCNVSKLSARFDSKYWVYNGESRKAVPDISFGGKVVTEGKDYDLEYRNNVEPGVATVTIKGKGNFTGERDLSFEIIQRLAKSDASVIYSKVNKDSCEPGKAVPILIDGISPQVTFPNDVYYTYVKLTKNGERLAYNCIKHSRADDIVAFEFTPEEPGDYLVETCWVTNKSNLAYENFKAETSATLQVRYDFTKAQVTGIANKQHTGDPITQTLALTFGGKALTEGKDYTIDYNNNVNVGTATVTISGKGDYRGRIVKTFEIIQKQAESVSDKVNGDGAGDVPEKIVSEYEKITDKKVVTPVSPGGTVKKAEEYLNQQKTATDVKGTTYQILQAGSKKVGAKSITLKWKSVSGAVSYLVYGVECSKGKKIKLL